MAISAPARPHDVGGRRSSVDAPPRSGGVYDWRYTALSSLTGAVAVALVVGVLAFGPSDAVAMVRDPLGVARLGDPLPTYVGWLSGAGILVWAASAGVLAVAARTCLTDRRPLALSYAVVAVLTAVLATDDMLLLHDAVIPGLLGVPEAATQLVEGALGVLWLVLSLGVLRVLRDDPALPVLGVALLLLGLSVLTDIGPALPYLHEESLKLGGIVCWALWAWGSARWATARPVLSGPAS